LNKLDLSEVSMTAFLPLLCRVIASGRQDAVINDPMAALCLERLMAFASEAEKARILKWKRKYTGSQAREARSTALRSANFDRIANAYFTSHPGCTLINLACGFDTRFWRIDHAHCTYLELDLPQMVALKREILQDHLAYELIACSVLDPSWIDQVTSKGKEDFLLLAEGLFYYFPKGEVVKILKEVARRFERSQLVMDTAPESYSRGLMKWLISLESRAWGVDVSFASGMKNPHEIESFASGFKVIGEEKGNVGPIIMVSINAS
jgi:O-methyltransferase involved in polyketide biosynthesis